MKLLNRTTMYLSASFVLVMGIWAVLLYVSMLDEIYDSIDDGLDNYKLLIIDKVSRDSSLLSKSEFNESNYAIREITKSQALVGKERYNDTLMYMRNEQDYEPVRILHTDFRHGDKYYQLQVITSMVEEDDLIADLLSYIIILYLLIIICIIVVNNVVLRRIWRPFYGILSQLKKFDLQHPRLVKVQPTRIAEFNDLNETVLSLLKNNISTYNSQKQFIENASHELQTPLAISISKIELLLEDEGVDQSHANTLAGILGNLERLTRLNKSLILISSIENRQYHDEIYLNFNEIIRHQVNEFAALAEFHEIKITVKEEGHYTWKMNRDLAVILVGNLVRNAIVHNYNGGAVEVVVNAECFAVVNTSHSPQLDRSRLFTRFYKDATKRNSIGLGLSIVHGICELSRLTVKYDYEDQLHSLTVCQ